MSDWTDDADLNEILGGTDGNNTIKVLREKIKADNEALKALKQEVASLRDGRKADLVGDALKSAGINPEVAKFYNGDADPTAVSAWVTENAALFGATSTNSTNTQQENTPTPIAGVPQVIQTSVPANPPVEQVDYARMLNAGVDGQPPSNYNDMMGKLNSMTSQEDLLSFLASQQ